MGRVLAFLYGMVCYAIFFVTFVYAIGFVTGLAVPKGIDSGPEGPLLPSLAIDMALLGVFAVQHSLMARPAFKAWWAKIVPAPVERSTYVLFSSLALALICWGWRPVTHVIWSVGGTWANVIWTLAAAGWLIVLLSTFLISHFDLFGLRQTWAFASGKKAPALEFRTPLFYRVVRHPIYVGFILAFWAAPVMSLGHLAFAIATTAYILIAIQLEERDLVSAFGEVYVRYQKQVSMIVPWPPSSSA
jgi:protein-S-isoprenylcysteine O-methyltransferase Ste14